jgi:MFS family permease
MRRALTANVILLGLVSLLTDFSSEIIFPLLPFFLTLELTASFALLGVMEGVAEGAASASQIVWGRASDRRGRRTPLIRVGYGLSAVFKPLFVVVPGAVHAVGLRIGERFTKGRGAPRDALLGESVDEESRGLVFGFHRAMDTVGAILGPVLILLLLPIIPPIYGSQYRALFLIAAVPAILAAVLVLFVRDTEPRAPRRVRYAPLRAMPKPLVVFIAIATIFAMANFSFIFFLLRAGIEGGILVAIGLYLAFNITYAVFSIPAGCLSDRVGRLPLLVAGFAAFAVSLALLVPMTSPVPILVPFVLYGLAMALSEGNQRAFMADLAPEGLKASSQGALQAAQGLAKLGGNAVAGLLAVIAFSWTFGVGAVLAGTATVAMAAFALHHGR